MEIVAQILQVVNDNNNNGNDGIGGGASKTKIMYKAFLSYAQLKEYLLLVTESGMLQYDKLTYTYRMTEKGLKFLKICNETVVDTTIRI